MATHIKLKDSTFKNTKLPNAGPFISEGLLGGWRFNRGSKESLKDLSENKHDLQEYGSVEFTEVGAICNVNNGFLTGIPEPKKTTLMAVARIPYITADNSGNFIITNYQDNKFGNSYGISLWTGFNIENNMTYRSQARSYVDESTGKQDNNILATNIIPMSEIDNFVFICMTLTEDTETLYCPTINETKTVTIIDNNFDKRYLGYEQLVIGCINKWANWSGTGSVSDESELRDIEIAEVFVYDRPLTEDEVMEQYNLSKDYYLSNHNISI